MTTRKKDDGRIKSTVKKAKENLEGVDGNPTVTVTTGYWKPIPIADDENENPKGEIEVTNTTATTDGDSDSDETYRLCWNDDPMVEKRGLAKQILVRLIDFNLEQLSRQDVDKTLIYENPAEYAAETVNELYERIK